MTVSSAFGSRKSSLLLRRIFLLLLLMITLSFYEDKLKWFGQVVKRVEIILRKIKEHDYG